MARDTNKQWGCRDVGSGRGEGGDLALVAPRGPPGTPATLEAAAPTAYFPALFGPGFTRGEDCLANAALNYGYAILRGAVARNLVIHGLEPCLGIFHRSQLNQFNLADDLMEPYRPLVDLYVASHLSDWEGEALTPRVKQQLVQLMSYLVEQDGRRYRAISAIGRMAESFSRIVQGERESLELPALLPLQPHTYE